MRVHVCAVRMTLHRADVLEAYLNGQDNIQKATVYERTGDVVLTYRGSRKDAVALLAAYRFDNEELEVLVTSHDSRKINQEYQEKMVNLVAGRVFRKVFLPAPIAAAYTVWRSIAFVWKGIRCLLHRKRCRLRGGGRGHDKTGQNKNRAAAIPRGGGQEHRFSPKA